MYCLLMTAMSVLARWRGRQLEKSAERHELAQLCRGHVALRGLGLGAAERFGRVGGMGFTWGRVFDLFVVFLVVCHRPPSPPSLFLPALQAQPGSPQYLHVGNFVCRMPEHEHVAHKLSQVKSLWRQCLTVGQAAFHPAHAEAV